MTHTERRSLSVPVYELAAARERKDRERTVAARRRAAALAAGEDAKRTRLAAELRQALREPLFKPAAAIEGDGEHEMLAHSRRP
jgi:hypothetical protein